MIPPHRAVAGAQCSTCGAAEWKYICPRCEVLSCSLRCQKEHSASCQDSFQRELARDGMSNMRLIPSDKKDFDSVLSGARKRLDQMDATDSEGSDEGYEEVSQSDEKEGEERLRHLKQLALDDKLTFSDLTPEEQMRFRGALSRGLLVGEVVSDYRPWYRSIELPFIEKGVIDHVCCTSGKAVQPAVFWQVVSLLLSWVTINLSMNGDILLSDDIPELTQHVKDGNFNKISAELMRSVESNELLIEAEARMDELIEMSGVLNLIKHEQTVEDCRRVIDMAIKPTLGYPRGVLINSVEDLSHVFSHPDKVLFMLMSISEFVSLLQRSCKDSNKTSESMNDSRSTLKKCRKLQLKLAFLQSFTKYHFSSFPPPDAEVFAPILIGIRNDNDTSNKLH